MVISISWANEKFNAKKIVPGKSAIWDLPGKQIISNDNFTNGSAVFGLYEQAANP